MRSTTRRSRSQLAAALAISLFLTLASCSEPTVTPRVETLSTRTPRATLSSVFDQYQFLGWVLDDQGANDTPAQSDLNAFTRADNLAGSIGVKWVWDDVNSWTGTGQTGDACALFDTDGDGKANAAVCVRISNPNGDPNVVAQLDSPASPLVYSCGDSKPDRCASPNALKPLAGTHCEVQKIIGETFFATGDDGADTEAACAIPFAAISATSSPNLLNVCSFPSGSPGSNAFDCVVTPGAGFLIIKKSTTPQSGGQTFSFTVSPSVVSGTTFNLVDTTSTDESTGLLSASPGTSYSVSEGTQPAGWQLNSASCARQTSPNPTPTGTKTGSSITGISITSGETTVCTFADGVTAPTIGVVKTATPDSIPETGGTVSYTVTVTNSSIIPVTLASLVDSVFGNLTGVGTCNGAGNAYGSIAVGGSYSCTFSKVLAASEASRTHINKVTASVTSDGGPATASDTARVRYTDVKPNITVTKSADINSISVAGGVSVDNFVPDETFSITGGGGGGTSMIFSNDICDDAGPNDQPAQVDLNCFSRADNISGRLGLKWTWDDINAWTGTGQTGDACALLDTNHNGTANYAFCVSVHNPNGDPTQIEQAPGSPVLYKCHDSAADRCASKAVAQTIDPTTICTVNLTTEHFPGQGDDGADTQALCNLKLTDLGTSISNIDLLNVCSFPSGSPNSNPFDCVVSPAAGFLVIAETTTPTSFATFGFVLGNGTATNGFTKFGVLAGASSAGIPILPGNVSLNQLMPTNWSISSVVCTRDGVTVASGTTVTVSSVSIVQGATTTCTFSNILIASSSVTFTVTVTNNSLEAVTLFSLEDTENPSALSPTYTSLNGTGTCTTGGTIVNGTPYTCTFARTISGSPGFTHSDKIRAVGKDNEANADTKTSNVVNVSIN